MGSQCSTAQNIQSEQKIEIKNEEQLANKNNDKESDKAQNNIKENMQVKMKEKEKQVYTMKLDLHNVVENYQKPLQPNTRNESILDITTERNLIESQPQNQLFGRKYFDDTQTINKSNYLVYSQGVDVLKDLDVKDAESQELKHKDKKKTEEECFDDLIINNFDFKFQAPFAMKMVDKLQQSTNLKGKSKQQQQQQQLQLQQLSTSQQYNKKQ